MIKQICTLAITLLVTFNIKATPFITYTPQANNSVGIYLGGQIWQSRANGTLGEKATLIDFDLKKEPQNHYFVGVEHSLYFLPNVRISSTAMKTTGNSNSSQAFGFGGEDFPPEAELAVPVHEYIVNKELETNLDTRLNIRYIDYTLYYKLFNNDFFSLDLGLTARDFDGTVTITGTTRIVALTDVLDHPGHTPDHVGSEISAEASVQGKMNINDTVAMINVSTGFKLPLKSLSLFAQGDYSLKSDHPVLDTQVGLSYEIDNRRVKGFNVTLGYRLTKMTFEEVGSLSTDLEFKGAFVGLVAHF